MKNEQLNAQTVILPFYLRSKSTVTSTGSS